MMSLAQIKLELVLIAEVNDKLFDLLLHKCLIVT